MQMKDDTKKRKVLVSTKVPPALEAKLDKLAQEEKRTVSNLVYVLLETHPRLQTEETELQAA